MGWNNSVIQLPYSCVKLSMFMVALHKTKENNPLKMQKTENLKWDSSFFQAKDPIEMKTTEFCI